MNSYVNISKCTNLVVDGKAIHIGSGETIRCNQEINNPFFRKINSVRVAKKTEISGNDFPKDLVSKKELKTKRKVTNE